MNNLDYIYVCVCISKIKLFSSIFYSQKIIRKFIKIIKRKKKFNVISYKL